MCQGSIHEFLKALPKCEHHMHLEGKLVNASVETGKGVRLLAIERLGQTVSSEMERGKREEGKSSHFAAQRTKAKYTPLNESLFSQIRALRSKAPFHLHKFYQVY
jgi:hypothetical protein